MAFPLSSQPATQIQAVGSFTQLAWAIVTQSGGAATVTFPQFKRVLSVHVNAQNSTNATRVTDITGNVVTIAGTGSEVVMVLAIGEGGF